MQHQQSKQGVETADIFKDMSCLQWLAIQTLTFWGMKKYKWPHSKRMLVISSYPLSNHDSVGKCLFACNGSMGNILPLGGPISSWSIWICWKNNWKNKNFNKDQFNCYPPEMQYRYKKWPYLKGTTLSKPSFWVCLWANFQGCTFRSMASTEYGLVLGSCHHEIIDFGKI